METLKGVKVLELNKGKSGTNQYGDWQGWYFKVDDPNWQGTTISFMQSGNKPSPVNNEKYDIEYEVNGKYYNAKKMTPLNGQSTSGNPKPQSSQPDQQPKPQPNNVQKMNSNGNPPPDPINFYLRYMADVRIAEIEAITEKNTMLGNLVKHAEEIAKAALAMKEIIEENTKKEEPKTTNGKGFLDYIAELKRQLVPDTYNLIVKDINLEKLDKEQQTNLFKDLRSALKEQVARESAPPEEEENIPF